MANVIEGLAQRLDAAGVGWYSTTEAIPDDVVPISVAGMPGTKGAAIGLYPYPGPESPDSRNGWEYPRMQVRARHADALAAQALLREVFNVLQGIGPETLPDGTELQDCHALESGPLPMGQDANGRHEYTHNYQLTLNG